MGAMALWAVLEARLCRDAAFVGRVSDVSGALRILQRPSNVTLRVAAGIVVQQVMPTPMVPGATFSERLHQTAVVVTLVQGLAGRDGPLPDLQRDMRRELGDKGPAMVFEPSLGAGAFHRFPHRPGWLAGQRRVHMPSAEAAVVLGLIPPSMAVQAVVALLGHGGLSAYLLGTFAAASGLEVRVVGELASKPSGFGDFLLQTTRPVDVPVVGAVPSRRVCSA